QAPALALASALIFAVHPIGTSVVTYVSQRAESMMALFLLASLYSWIRQRENPEARAWGVLAVICSILSMLCKEVGYATPLIAALLDRAYFSDRWSDLWRERKGLYLAMFSSWIVVIASLVFGARGATVTWTYREYDSWTYLLTSARAILHYTRLLVWPQPLIIDYGWPIARTLADAWWQVAVLTGALVGSLLCLGRRPKLACAGLSVFIILAPSSSFVPIVTEIMAEHRMYLPSTIVITLVVVGLYLILRRLPTQIGRTLAALSLVGAMALSITTTQAQNRLYNDALTMHAHNTLHTPDNYRAHYNLGYFLSRVDRYDEALRSLAAAIRIDPTYAAAHRETAYIACYQGRMPAALKHIDRALELRPEDPYNLTAKGAFLALVKRPEAGLPFIEKALVNTPGFAEAMKWKVNVYLLAQKGRAADRALAEYDPTLSPQQRQRDLQVRYRDLMQMVQASERP
ncbi:MAG: Tfp pilus assembly protein PilF, partial [Chlamydiales bacterium]